MNDPKVYRKLWTDSTDGVDIELMIYSPRYSGGRDNPSNFLLMNLSAAEAEQLAKELLNGVNAIGPALEIEEARRFAARGGHGALEGARTEAAARNARNFGTDPSWYGR